jgi:hypothetical protein
VKRGLRQRIEAIANAYDESLAAVGAPRLTEEQCQVLKAFLTILYEEAQSTLDDGRCLSQPELAG